MRRKKLWSGLLVGGYACLALLLAGAGAVRADNAPPAMITPGQFNVSATGAFTYSIPIAVPPGTGGMTPALSLDYSSQSGDGLEGMGWILSGLPSIGRCPQTIAQDGVHGSVNFQGTDRFCMEGQRLVMVVGATYGANNSEYRTEIEGFSRIIAHGTSGTGPAWFEVHTKAGQIMYFGYNEDADNTNNNSRLTLSANNSTARGWAVEKIADTKGNYLTVKYAIGTKVVGSDTDNVEARPTRIDYTGNKNSSTALTPFASVQFLYNQDRAPAQIIPTYQAGYLLQTTKLLTNVQTFVGITMITDYRLAYNSLSTTIQRYELASVTQCDSTPTGCLKPTTFGWQGSRNGLTLTPTDRALTNGGAIAAGEFTGDGLIDLETGGSDTSGCAIYHGPDFTTQGPPAKYDRWLYDSERHQYVMNPNYFGPICLSGDSSTIPIATGSVHGFVDIDADGFSDVLLEQRVDTMKYNLFPLINQGGTVLAQAENGSGSRIALGINPFDVADFNGDGRTDVFGPVSPNPGANFLWIGSGLGTFPCSSPCTSFDHTDSYVLADFDGDGCTDIFERGATNKITYSFLCKPAAASVSVSISTSSEIALGDFNGDGKADILVAPQSGQPTLNLSTGTGLASAITLSGTEFANWGKYIIYAGDWNGDGKADLLLVAPGKSNFYGPGTSHKIYLSTGAGFVQASGAAGSISNTNSQDTNVTASVADWNNDGASDIWLQRNGSGDAQYSFSYVPELMNSVDNGIGAKTIVSYAPLNQNASLYQKCSNGSFACNDAYPTLAIDGPLYVVQQIDSSNGLGSCAPPTDCYSSAYAYSGAKYDQGGRGFLGFQSMSVTDLQTNIVQTTTYATDFPQTGLITLQTKTCPDKMTGCPVGGVTLNSTQNTYDVVALGNGVGNDTAAQRKFVALKVSTVASNDLDGSAMPSITTTYTYDCDSGSACSGTSPTGFGNATQIVVKNLSDNSTKTTTNTYTNDAANWYLGRLITANVRSIVGASDLTRQTSYAYDPGTGLLTQEFVEPESSSDPTLKLETDYVYDDYGNKTSSTAKGCVWAGPTNCSTTNGPATRETDTLFWVGSGYNGQFATRVTNALGQYERWSFNSTADAGNGIPSAFGVPDSHTGPNGLITSWKYDTFGRKILETRPDGNQTAIGYFLCGAVGCPGLPSTVASVPPHTHFIVVSTPEDSSGAQNGPITVAYYDSLSRAVGSDVEGFDGTGTGCTLTAPCWIRVQTQYDSNGRPYRTSRPYFPGATLKWTVNSYDTVGRIYLVTLPDTSIVNYGFHGLTTTVVNDKGQVTTTVKNVQGFVASVQNDDNKTVSYTYDAFGDLVTVTDPQANVASFQYDIRGRKTQASDPDMGAWTYVYDGFGELYSQVDAKSKRTALHYDILGRVVERDESDLTSTWTYDTAVGAGIGQLATATTDGGYTRTPAYDSLGRPFTATLTVDGTSSQYTIRYNSDGRIKTIAYPSGFTARYDYTTLGYLYQVSDNDDAQQVFWTANTRDAELHLLSQTGGNSVSTTQTFDANTGRPLTIRAGTGNSVSNQVFSFDTLGNLTKRTWLNNSGAVVTENACYDNLNRVTDTLVAPGTSCTGTGAVSVAYDMLGNIKKKTDVCNAGGCFNYGENGAGPHALTSIVGTYNGVTNPTFSYDANGNMVSGAGRTITSNSFNMVALVVSGANTLALTYDSEHARIKQVATGANAGTTYYLNDAASGAVEEEFVAGSTTTWRDYITADGKMVAERFKTGKTVTLNYFVLDHLGSISVITDSTGNVLERLSFDAWGKRRNADGSSAACGAIASSASRGFTGQEMMDAVCFVNFNARVYDPSLGRFMSADPVTQSYYNLQLLNRYSYVGNNPLSLTDPTGLCFLGCFWNQSWFVAIAAVAVAVFVPVAIGGWGVFASAAAGNFSAIATVALGGAISGGVSAGLSGGNIFKGVLFGGVSAGLTVGLGGAIAGNLGVVLANPTLRNFIAYGLVGGLSSEIQGGNFASGFLAGGVGSLAGPLNGGQFDTEKLVASAVVGGLASVLGGGKFANGATSGAFSYAVGSWASDTAVGQEPSDISNDVQPNEHLAITAANNTISGTVHVNCGYGIGDCGAMIAVLNAADTTAGGYTLDALFVQATPGTMPDLTLIARPLSGNVAAQTCCFTTTSLSGGVSFTYVTNDNRSITIDLAKYSESAGDLTHEAGHFLGLHHEANVTNSVMSYSPTRASTFNADELQRLYNAYHH